jgi:uncharacterized protein
MNFIFKSKSRPPYTEWLKRFILANLVIFYLIASLYLRHFPLPNTTYSSIFSVFTYIGTIGILFFLTLIPVALMLLFYPRFYLVIVAIVIVSLSQLVLIIDTFVFASYSFHVNLIMLKVIFGPSMIEFFGLNMLEVAMAYALVLAIIVAEVLLAIYLWKKKPLSRFRIRMTMIIVVLIVFELISQWMYAYAYALGKQSTLQNSRVFPAYVGTIANTTFVKFHILSPKQIIKQNIQNTHSNNIKAFHYPLHPLTGPTIKNPPNIVMIGIDAWRADTMKANIVPHIYQFSKQASRFYNHYSGGNATLPGIYTLYYSVPSLYWNATNTPPAIFDEMQKYNYRQGVFFSAEMRYPPFYKNVFLTVKGLKISTPGDSPYIRDKNITDEGLDFLNQSKKSKKPFFMFLFYDAAHSYSLDPKFKHPFQPIKAMVHSELTDHTDPTPYFNVYKNALYYDDNLINRVLQRLKTLGDMKNTIIIITSDHGEEFNDNHKGYWGHVSNFTQFQTHIPLMIYWPGRKIQNVSYRTSHYDVMPTLLQDVFKVKNPAKDYSIGNNLFSKSSAWKILPVGSYSYEGLIAPPLIYRFYPFGVTGVYDMSANMQKSFPANGKDLRTYLTLASRYAG